MKKTLVLVVVLVVLSSFSFGASIEAGDVFYSAGHYLESNPIPMGFDMYGYNYNEYMFKGSYANIYLGGAGFPPYMGDDEEYLMKYPDAEMHWAWLYRNDRVIMKWNDAWLSNMDRDEDGVLDRHWGLDSYVDSGAWLTNHIKEDGKGPQYFVKIKAVELEDKLMMGFYYRDDIELGPAIWGSFYEAQIVENGLRYASPWGAELDY